MNDLEDKNNSNAYSAGENNQFNPDPIVQSRDDSSKSTDGIKLTEIMPIAKKPVSVVDATLLPHQFTGGGIRQAAPSSTELLASILRFKWTILVVFVLVAAPVVAAIWTQMVPKYQARAEIRVRPIIPRLVFRTEDNGMIPLYGSFLNTQVSIIRGMTILQRVLDRKEIQETQWYKKPQQSLIERLRGNPTTPIERLNDTLSVRPRSRTEIIDVSFADSNVKDAKLIVNAILDEYIQYIGEQTNAEEDKLYQQLTEQYRSLQTQIQGQEAATAAISKSLGTETPQELISSKRLRLDETQARLNALRQRIAVSEWEIKHSNPDDSNNIAAVAPADSNELHSKYFDDAEWLRLDANVRIMRHNIETSLRTPKHPDTIRAQKELASAEEALRLREAQLVEYQLARTKHAEELLAAELEKQQAEFIKLFDTAQSLDKQNNSLRHMHELFDAVRQRLEQKNVERDVPGSIEVSMRAFASSRPYNDRRIVFTVMSLALALGMGGGFAFLRAGRNQAIYTSKDMPYPMQAPLLGYIPVTRISKLRGKSLYDEIMRSRSHLIESVRIVRTVLLSRLNGQNCATLLITSSDEGTGKTSFTMMLGKSLAQAGKNVLMIDSDLHKMSLTKQFELSDKFGLKDSLSGGSTDKQYVFPTNTPGLSIMPVGKKDNDNAVFEQTANGTFKAFISQLHKQYNIILLDSPPILALADAAILSGQVDGTIIVERELVSRRANIIDALARLDSAGGCVLGTVFIGSSDYEKYGYGYHYSNYTKTT
ncbi:MAG: AAA family ATPase [Sedimentisphaerales bacterium]|nr:AAA family ATPase [Sedimentisphaerales bacterium]